MSDSSPPGGKSSELCRSTPSTRIRPFVGCSSPINKSTRVLCHFQYFRSSRYAHPDGSQGSHPSALRAAQAHIGSAHLPTGCSECKPEAAAAEAAHQLVAASQQRQNIRQTVLGIAGLSPAFRPFEPWVAAEPCQGTQQLQRLVLSVLPHQDVANQSVSAIPNGSITNRG